MVFLVLAHLVPFAIILFTLCCTKIRRSNNSKKSEQTWKYFNIKLVGLEIMVIFAERSNVKDGIRLRANDHWKDACHFKPYRSCFQNQFFALS